MNEQTDPKWLVAALKEIGTRELEGLEHNPRIIEYHEETSLRATTDEVPWCSSFINWCMAQAGIKGTRSAAARSWLKWGRELETPIRGCVVVLPRGKSSWQGHVGLFIEFVNNGKHFNMLGGNQSDTVKLQTFRTEDVLGFMWPDIQEEDSLLVIVDDFVG